MNNYHIIGVLERDVQRREIDQQLPAANAQEAMNYFTADGWYWPDKVTVMRLPCVDESAYSRQVAMARDEMAEFWSKPNQMRMKI